MLPPRERESPVTFYLKNNNSGTRTSVFLTQCGIGTSGFLKLKNLISTPLTSEKRNEKTVFNGGKNRSKWKAILWQTSLKKSFIFWLRFKWQL